MEKSFPDIVVNSNHCFSNKLFYQHLERCNLLTGQTGWDPIYFSREKSVLPGFIKSHSYGEFIFDWAWANFYARFGINYYPKLVHCTPFTPVNAPKIIGENCPQLFQDSFDFYQQQPALSGEHYLFISDEEEEILKSLNFKIMKTIQYHFINKWESFDAFLEDLKKGRRKMIKKERLKVAHSKVEIEWLSDYSEAQLDEIYLLYISTIAKKQSQAYLNRAFFMDLGYLTNVKILVARLDQKIIAMSLFFESSKALYGRYWGIDPSIEHLYPFLHFEMCYYRGLDYIFKKNLPLFEAGAQGEQKLWRGFTPVVIKSAHHIKRADLFGPIKDYINDQNKNTINEIENLKKYLPFKEKNEKAQ